MDPAVSVLIPSYNHAAYLSLTIRSVLNQTFSDFELLICDDCSTDASWEVITQFTDPRIHAEISPHNMGVVRTLNHLMAQAKGTYIAILGSDDLWAPNKLEKQIAYMEEHPKDACCFTWAQTIDENGNSNEATKTFDTVFSVHNRSRSEWIKRFYNYGNCLCHSSLLIRTDIQKSLGEYHIGYCQLHDFDMWVRLVQNGSFSILEEPLVQYRRAMINNTSISASTQSNQNRLYIELQQILLDLICGIKDEALLKELCPEELWRYPEAAKFLFLLEQSAPLNLQEEIVARYLVCNMSDELVRELEASGNIPLRELYRLTAFCQNQHKMNEKIAMLQGEADAYHAILNSSIWRLTKPLRVLLDCIDHIIHKE